MPRKDKTFSEKDIFRLFERHLTSQEQELVLKYFKKELEIETDLWPAPLCYYLGELTELVQFGVRTSIDIWNMSSLMRKIVDYILDVAGAARIIPVIGDIIYEDVQRVHYLINQFHVDTAEKLKYLEEYFATFEEYIAWKCFKR